MIKPKPTRGGAREGAGRKPMITKEKQSLCAECLLEKEKRCPITHTQPSFSCSLFCSLKPGSKEAVDAGCQCPVLDNAHGKGYMGLEGIFVYNGNCPIHIKNETPK